MAVERFLLHYINNLEYNLRRDLTSFINEKVTSLRESLSEDLMDYKNQTVSDLHTSLQSNTQQLCAKMDTLDLKMEAHDNHVTTELMELDKNLQQNFTLQLKNSYGYVTTPPIHTCGGTGGWRRVVYLNFTDPNTPCPSSWRLTSHSKRTCGRVNTSASCDSVSFPVSGGDYTRVCGRIIGYQYNYVEGFEAYDLGTVTTIDGPYVDGVSLTHGSPRQHIWTFVDGYSEFGDINDACPCDTTVNIAIPPFVGEDYFCESGWNSDSEPSRVFYSDDPLWDGDGCTASSTCCSFNNPPYFTKQLPSPTTDDIEARICDGSHWSNDIPIEFIELYVQ